LAERKGRNEGRHKKEVSVCVVVEHAGLENGKNKEGEEGNEEGKGLTGMHLGVAALLNVSNCARL
jgi:hypothetical protein